MTTTQTLNGPRAELSFFPEDAGYTSRLRGLDVVPEKLYAIGDVDVLDSEMLAVIGVRRGTPYGYRCVDRFVGFAAGEGVTVLTGGARGVFSTADAALGLNRPVFAIPGSVFCDASRGCNALLEVGAVPVYDERSFEAALANAGFSAFQPF